MTYTPFWPEWAETTRASVDKYMASLEDEGQAAVGGMADFIGEQLRHEFPDLDKAIVGWVTMRACSHLGALANQAPISTETLAMVGLMAGHSIAVGDV